jgi:hypothetical protein
MANKILQICKDNYSFRKLLIYILRWQLSTPILAAVMWLWSMEANPMDSIGSAVVANLVGSLIFFWVDLVTFSIGALEEQWEVLDNSVCCDCGVIGRGYRRVIAPGYNRLKSIAEYRCEACSIRKSMNGTN